MNIAGFKVKGPILYSFVSISHNCQRSNNIVSEIYSVVSVVLDLNCLKVTLLSSSESRLFLCLHLYTLMSSVCQRLPCLLHPSQGEDAAYTSGSMR